MSFGEQQKETSFNLSFLLLFSVTFNQNCIAILYYQNWTLLYISQFFTLKDQKSVIRTSTYLLINEKGKTQNMLIGIGHFEILNISQMSQ